MEQKQQSILNTESLDGSSEFVIMLTTGGHRKQWNADEGKQN